MREIDSPSEELENWVSVCAQNIGKPDQEKVLKGFKEFLREQKLTLGKVIRMMKGNNELHACAVNTASRITANDILRKNGKEILN